MSGDIPDNDTPTPQDVWEHDLTFHSEKVMSINRASGDYYLLVLPYKIEKFGWNAGKDYLMLQKVEDNPPYIRVEFPDEKFGRHQRISSKKAIYKLVTRGSKRPRIRIPKMWADEFLSYDGYEALSVELNEIGAEPHVRIYDPLDVNKRKSILMQQDYTIRDGPSRIIAPFGLAYSIKEFVVDKARIRPESIEVEIPDNVSNNSVVNVTSEADLPDLKRLSVRHRHRDDPGWTVIDQASVESSRNSKLPRPFKMNASYDLSEDNGPFYENEGPEIHQFQARAEYGNEEYIKSDIEELKLRS